MDNWLGNIAGIFAIGVAWFPTAEIAGEGSLSSTIHYISATIFFLSLAVFSLFLFTKCNKEKEIFDGKISPYWCFLPINQCKLLVKDWLNIILVTI